MILFLLWSRKDVFKKVSVFVSGVQCCGKTPLSFNVLTQTIGTFSKILLFLKSFLSTDLVVCEVLIIK